MAHKVKKAGAPQPTALDEEAASPSSKVEPQPLWSYTVRQYEDHVEVDIENFDKTNPGKIQRTVLHVLQEWQSKQRDAVIKQNREDRRKAMQAEHREPTEARND